MSAADAAEWLRLARQDLEVARLTLGQRPPLLEPALFHSHQAMEKALKSVLARADLTPPRTHDLEVLLRVAAGVRPELATLGADARLLTAYGIAARYPGLPGSPDVAAAEHTVRAAERALAAVEDASDA